MSSYLTRVAENILPRSVLQTLPEAFTEWHVNHSLVDHGWPCAVCELCEQESLRWHFGISNAQTDHRLTIGSRCILRFDIEIRDAVNNRRIASEAAGAYLDGMVRDLQREDCLGALEALVELDPHPGLEGALDRCKDKGSLTPRQAAHVLGRLAALGIEHHPDYFKVSLQRGKYRGDLVSLKPDQIAALWPALTPAQRERATWWGIQAPPPAPVRRMTSKAKPWPYTKWRALATDAELVAHGYMTMTVR
jgi:hypothetical protein